MDRNSESTDTGGFVILTTAANKAGALLLFLAMSEKKDRLAFLSSKL